MLRNVSYGFNTGKMLFNANKINRINFYRYCSTNNNLKNTNLKTGMNSILSDYQRNLLERQTASFKKTSTIITKTNFTDIEKDNKIIENAAKDLNEFFNLVFCGEYSAGKSSFVNALLSKNVLEKGPTPTTENIHYIKYGEYDNRLNEDGVLKLPIEWLKDINLIDTPGLNSLHADHQQRTTEFIPRSDIIFFLTSVSQVLSKSEKKFLDYIRKWNKKAVIILSKKDLVNNDDLEKIEKYLKSHFEKEFGYVPVVIPTSSKHFFDSLEERDPERGQQLYNQSGIPELKNHINNTLTSSERIKMKLQGKP